MPGQRPILLQSTFAALLLAVIAAPLQHSLLAAPTSLITSSVKLRVDVDGGHDWGTGTIIDTREGEALIITCGHIFRGSKGKGNIEVHLFGEHSTVRVLGTCLFYDDSDIDLALVYITLPSSYPVRAVPIAPVSYQIQPSRQAWSVGCDSGGNPSVQTHQILSTDRVSTPKTNRVPFYYVQVSGAPVGGRSGGGLFSAEGYLIGVCNTGDPVVNDGHFVPPHVIRHVLDTMNLAHIYQNPSLGDVAASVQVPTSPSALTALTPLQPIEPNLNPPLAAAGTPLPMYAENQAAMSLEEQATLEEVKRRKQDGDEVILIVRSLRNPEIPSDVIVLSGTSDQFLDALIKSPSAGPPGNPAYNSVIFSSHDKQPSRQPVSFPVRY